MPSSPFFLEPSRTITCLLYTSEHWATVTFRGEETIDRVALCWAASTETWTSRRYEVQVWAGSGWKTVASVSGGPVEAESVHRFAPAHTSRVRILQPGGGGPQARANLLWLTELKAFRGE